jgi:hypothetical protein
MKSDIQDGFETFASSFDDDIYSHKFQAFIDNPPHGCGCCSNGSPPQFIGIKLPSPKISNFMTIQTYGWGWKCSPQSFRIESSNDGISFITLAEFSTYFTDSNQTRNYKFNNKMPFTHYRIYIESNFVSGWCGFKHLNFGFVK